MSSPIQLQFESTLPITPDTAWRWITDVDLLRAEMRPWLRMSVPPGVRSLDDLTLVPGRPLFTSSLWLLGCLPMGHSHLTLESLEPGHGFVECSLMTGMRLWRHERTLHVVEGGVRLCDRLTFEPYLAATLVRTLTRFFFHQRHRVLRHRATATD